MNTPLFEEACDKIIGQSQGLNGIGTLSEKTVHAVLKYYLCPNETFHEVKLLGYVADIFTGEEIIEIQTKHFNKLRAKLEAFLPNYPVTVVYPISHIKYLRWINPQSGEISAPRKSPKKGSPYEIFPELYKIKYLLDHPNLRFKIMLIDLEEYRFLDGWSADKKKGSTKCDRIPTNLHDEITLSCANDYQYFTTEIPNQSFTSKEYRKYTKTSLSSAQTTLNILYHMQVVDRIGKEGRAYLYEKKFKINCQDS